MQKNYLIIGGSNGIGKALSKELKNKEQNVFATYFKNESDTNGINYQYYSAEENNELQNLPDVLHGIAYCPGTIDLKPINRITAEQMLQDYKIQVVGVVNVIKQVLSKLKQADQASIVLFSTVAVNSGFPFHALVASSKGAIQGLTTSLAAELAPKIRVNCVAPSITQTPLAQHILNTEEKIAANALRHPLKAIGQPEDVASLAAFLISEESKWITGQVIGIDGGMSKLKI
jgi:NAD(P)-dependent dehydrogenase (short-subunit alcohol dehydrogenase family)